MPRTKPGRTGVVLEVLAAGRPRLRAHLPRHQARSARSVRIRRAAAGARAAATLVGLVLWSGALP